MNNIINMSKIPQQVFYIMNQVEKLGYNIYLTGGATRDLLLGKDPHDFDLTTSCPLEVLQSLFPDNKVVGASFGVLLVKIDNLEVQIARFRIDGDYNDSRHPDSVVFTDNIMEDLSRRDFTVNTFSMNNKGNLIYYPGALDDLQNGIIRAVGNPFERFNEDALRMLRCVRFACQLNFKIHHKTRTAIRMLYRLINNISKERVQEELNKILLSNNPSNGFYDLFLLELLHEILPEVYYCTGCNQNQYHKFDVLDHLLETLKYVPEDLSLRLAALLHDIGKPECKSRDELGNVHFYNHEEVSAQMAEQIMRRLKYSNDIIDEVVYLIYHHMELMNDQMKTNKGCRKLLNRHGVDRLRKLIEFRRADLLGSGTRDQTEVEELIQNFRSKLEEVLEEKPAIKLCELAIDGNDIMRMTGHGPGKRIGEIKNELMNIVLEYPELNTKEDLLGIVFRDYGILS